MLQKLFKRKKITISIDEFVDHNNLIKFNCEKIEIPEKEFYRFLKVCNLYNQHKEIMSQRGKV